MTRESTPQRKIVDMSKQQGLSFLPFSFSGLIRKYEEAFGPISEEVTRIGSDFIFVDVLGSFLTFLTRKKICFESYENTNHESIVIKLRFRAPVFFHRVDFQV